MTGRLLIEVVYADGSSFEQVVEGETIVVGAGAQADLQIRRAPEVEDEHLLLVPRRGGCWVSTARSTRVRPLVGGAPFDNGLLPFGTEIDVGSVTLRARLPTPTRKLKLPTLVLALAPAFALSYVYLKRTEEVPRTSAEPPALFDEVPKSCPDAQNPKHKAAEAMMAGDAREAQYVYDPQKGIAAGAAFAVAEVCAAASGNPALRDQARARREAVVRRVEGDFRAQRVALDRSLALEQNRGVLAAVRGLQPFLIHRRGEYAEWLSLVERHVQLRLEKESEDGDKNRKVSL